MDNPWRYSSKRFDPETGLVYFGRRYYAPDIGRWITADPAGFIDSINLYQYVFNNPYRFVDFDGRLAFVLPLLMVGFDLTVTWITAETITATVVVAGLGVAASKINTWHENRYCNEQTTYLMRSKKKGGIDESHSENPLSDPNLEDVSHPKGREKGHYRFKDKKTGTIIEYDKGKPGAPGHKGHDHYHRPNPNSTNNEDLYLDSQGYPTSDGHESSHLYPPSWVWW